MESLLAMKDERGCMCTFKSQADKLRHLRLCHDTVKSTTVKYVCNFKTDEGRCGMEFEKHAAMLKHKRASKHSVPRGNNKEK